jgi:hypothetical protein
MQGDVSGKAAVSNDDGGVSAVPEIDGTQRMSELPERAH